MSLKTPLIFIIAKSDQTLLQIRSVVLELAPFQSQILDFPGIEQALETTETRSLVPTYLIVDHPSSAMLLIRTLIGITPSSKTFILSNNDEQSIKLSTEFKSAQVCAIANLESGLKLWLQSVLPRDQIENETYQPILLEVFEKQRPLEQDVYRRMPQGNYVRIFEKGSELEEADIRLFKQKKENIFYRKLNSEETVKAQNQELDQALAQPETTLESAQKTYNKSVETIRDVLKDSGFNAASQEIAKKSVQLALKALGSKPRLKTILQILKEKQGDYIITHSYLVGQVACALAHQIGWNSNTTFLKLSLAAFLHDISLKDSKLAKVHDFEISKDSGLFTPEELTLIRSHPIKAAEFSRTFNEIPSDVDQILSQHHERPDGKGFPKNLPGKMISPLAALFIIAHDLVHALLHDPRINADDFLKKNSEYYNVGQFKKIWTAYQASTLAQGA